MKTTLFVLILTADNRLILIETRRFVVGAFTVPVRVEFDNGFNAILYSALVSVYYTSAEDTGTYGSFAWYDYQEIDRWEGEIEATDVFKELP